MLPWWLWCTIGGFENLGKCYVSNPVAKTLVWIENHDWHNCFCMSSWGSPLLDPKKLQNEQFYIVDWIRKNSWSMLPIWLLAAMMIMMYYWRFWEPWANAMLAILLPNSGLDWNHDWHNCICMSSWGSPYWTQKSFKTNSLRNRLNKEKTPGRCCQSGSLLPWWLWCTIGGLGTLGKCYVSNPVAKTLVWIENHDWHQLFLHVFLGLTLTGPKKASKRTVLHNRVNKEKTPGRCCQSGSLLPWWWWCTIGGLGTLGKCYVSNPVAKIWFRLKSMTGTTVFACLPGAHPYWTQKSFKTNSFT